MATLRRWLDSVNFDWSTGKVIVQTGFNQGYGSLCPEGDGKSRLLDPSDPLLDIRFVTKDGLVYLPEFIAEDSKRIYFKIIYRNSGIVDYVNKDLCSYLKEEIPVFDGTVIDKGTSSKIFLRKILWTF